MKTVAMTVMMTLGLATTAGAHPQHHTKHNMVLLGDSPIFASHIVYKVPHNYQVILEMAFDPSTLELYRSERMRHPSDLLIFLLDPLNISEIRSLKTVSGTLIREDGSGTRKTLREGVQIPEGAFRVIYFDEVPLDLGAGHSHPQAFKTSAATPTWANQRDGTNFTIEGLNHSGKRVQRSDRLCGPVDDSTLGRVCRYYELTDCKVVELTPAYCSSTHQKCVC